MPASRSKGSRKGKKAWRRNVDASDAEAVLAAAAAAPIPKRAAASRASDELFFVDKVRDGVCAVG